MPAPGSANAESRDKGHTRPAVGNGIPAGAAPAPAAPPFWLPAMRAARRRRIRQSKAHQRRSAISRKPWRAGYREIHLLLVIRAQLPAQRRWQALVNNPLSLRQIGQRLHRMACQPGRRGDGQDRETGYPRRPIAGIGHQRHMAHQIVLNGVSMMGEDVAHPQRRMTTGERGQRWNDNLLAILRRGGDPELPA